MYVYIVVPRSFECDYHSSRQSFWLRDIALYCQWNDLVFSKLYPQTVVSVWHSLRHLIVLFPDFWETRSELLLCWSGHRNISDWYCSIHSSEDSFTFSEALHLFCFERHPCFWARACLSSKIKVFSVIVVTGHLFCELVDFLWLRYNHSLFSGLWFSAIVVGWSLLSSLRLVSFGPPLSPLLSGINFNFWVVSFIGRVLV